MRDVVVTGSVSDLAGVSARRVFDLVTDVSRLPEWNEIITRVVERPTTLEPGAEWVVELKAMGSSWRSRARVVDVDASAGRFAYRSQTDDGNPSYGDWVWQIDDDDAGARITVAWELHPETFWRQALLVRIRHRLLRKEVRASLRSLESTLLDTGGQP